MQQQRSSPGLTYEILVLPKQGGMPQVWKGRAACLMDAFALARNSFGYHYPKSHLTLQLIERRDSE